MVKKKSYFRDFMKSLALTSEKEKELKKAVLLWMLSVYPEKNVLVFHGPGMGKSVLARVIAEICGGDVAIDDTPLKNLLKGKKIKRANKRIVTTNCIPKTCVEEPKNNFLFVEFTNVPKKKDVTLSQKTLLEKEEILAWLKE